MNKIYKITINRLFITLAMVFVIFGSITYSAKNNPPVISNVQAEQRSGTEEAVITYDVDDPDGDTLTISVQISDDNGQTFTVPAKTFSGDIGAGINPGKNKRIVWDAGKDLTELYDMDFRAKIIADDGKESLESVLYKQGLTSLNQFKMLEAKSVFEKILALNPQYEGVNLQLGLIAEWQKNLDEAIAYYEKEIQLYDSATEAHQNLAKLYLTHKFDYAKAEKEFQKAISQNPNHVPTLIHYGNLLYNQEKYDAAAKQFEIAVHIEPEAQTSNYYLALMYDNAGKKNLAIAQWKKFLQLNPPEQWAEKARARLSRLEK